MVGSRWLGKKSEKETESVGAGTDSDHDEALSDNHEEEHPGYDSDVDDRKYGDDDEHKYDDDDSEDQVDDFAGEDHDSSSHKSDSDSDDDSDFAGMQENNSIAFDAYS